MALGSEKTELNRVGAVIIGRNEGERLRRCLESVVGAVSAIVYVDSASTDQSVEVAESFGATVVNLDQSTPFTAARARNTGFRRLMEMAPHLEHVQFIDGDCQMIDTWWNLAAQSLEENKNVVAICGRQNESDRNRTIYNRLMDMEWDTPVGDVKSCAGCAMYRADAFAAVDGFNSSVIAGEEPELCIRLRARGWSILRIDTPMAFHDANMTRFSQWWMRSVRTGYAYAQGSAMHGKPPERHWVRETRSIWFWGFVLPLLAAFLAVPTRGWSLLLLGSYLVLFVRVRWHTRRRGYTRGDATVYAFFTVLGKWPQVYGQTKYLWRAIRGSRHTLIEHRKL